MVTAVVHQAFGSERKPLPLSVWHWTGVSPYTSACALAETCVFGKQSPRSFLCDPRQLRRQHKAASSPARALLLPKLRSQFAEFLNEGSLARLRILSLPTCVGLRYGHLPGSLVAFPGSMGSTSSSPLRQLPVTSRVCGWRIYLPSPYRLGRTLPIVRMAYPSASPHRL